MEKACSAARNRITVSGLVNPSAMALR
jgi:hypothetical protein